MVLSFIGTSLGGLMGDDTIVEKKCPYATFKSEITIEEAIIAKKNYILKTQQKYGKRNKSKT